MNRTRLLSKFQEVVWREVLYCYDDDETYAYKLLTLLPDNYENRAPQSVFRNRPKLFELEDALYQINKITFSRLARETWAEPLQGLRQSKDNPVSAGKLVTQLNSRNWVTRFIARHTIVYLGGETIPFLVGRLSGQSEERSETIKWLLENIALETSKELPEQAFQLLCPNCVVMCGKNEIELIGNRSLTFYGCQRCCQSRKFIERPAQIVAMLDAKMRVRQRQNEKGEVLWINWLKRKTLFEFDRVEIIEATDEEVELFAIQVGNDTDETRKQRYKDMDCIVRLKCNLSENTMRILQRTFGQVERCA